ncbi:MAG TPA: hypothetical protein VFH22_10775, partial [Rhodocyclaceae bacterium]|nr:hypothetical protein [Rhodocyclaceae bacterium]
MSVTYRSDSDPDFKCLEHYLECGEFGSLPDAWKSQAQHDMAQMNEILRKVASITPWLTEETREQLTFPTEIELPTKFDSPLNFQLLDGLIKKIKSAAVRVGLDVTSFPHYSNIPTRQVNACAVNLACSTRPFLLFDSQLFLFCHLFAKAFARCLPVTESGDRLELSTDLDEVRKRINSVPDVLERLIDVLTAYVTTDAPSNAKPYPLEGDYVHMAQIIRDGMELFVVAHEFGHVYAGHIGDLLAGTRLNMTELAKGNESHQQEHEADLLGLILTMHAMADQGYDAGTSYIGIELFFVALEMVERCNHFVRDGADFHFESKSSESHPSNQSRRKLLQAAIGHFVEP